MIESIFTYLMLNYPFTTGAIIVVTIGLSGALLSEYKDRKNKRK